jgi:hypothetical protein
MREEEIKSFLPVNLGLFGESECANKQKAKAWTKIVDYVFLGYAIHSMGYRFLIINSGVPDITVGIIMESRDVTFFEDEFPMKNNTPSMSSHDSISIPESHEPIVHADVETHEEISEDDNNTVAREGYKIFW